MRFGAEAFDTDNTLIDGTPPKEGEEADFIYRQQWGADPERPPEKLLKLLPVPVESLVMTWTETPRCYNVEECSATVREVQRKHIASGMPDIRYHFLVGMDGNVYEGRGPRWQGIQYAINADDSELISGNSVEVALIDKSGTKPHYQQLKGVSAVVNLGFEFKWLLPVFKFYLSKGAMLAYFKPFNAMEFPIATGKE